MISGQGRLSELRAHKLVASRNLSLESTKRQRLRFLERSDSLGTVFENYIYQHLI